MIVNPLSSKSFGIFSKKTRDKKSQSVADKNGDIIEEVSSEKVQGDFFGEVEVAREKNLFRGEEQKRQMIAKWIGELERYGEGLATAPSVKSFVLYRNTLEKLLKLSSDAYQVTSSYQTVDQGRTKEYLRVEVISKELESLLSLIKNRSKDSLAIAEKVISIKGLVIDLVS